MILKRCGLKDLRGKETQKFTMAWSCKQDGGEWSAAVPGGEKMEERERGKLEDQGDG